MQSSCNHKSGSDAAVAKGFGGWWSGGSGSLCIGGEIEENGGEKSGKMERKWHPVKCGQRQILTPRQQ